MQLRRSKQLSNCEQDSLTVAELGFFIEAVNALTDDSAHLTSELPSGRNLFSKKCAAHVRTARLLYSTPASPAVMSNGLQCRGRILKSSPVQYSDAAVLIRSMLDITGGGGVDAGQAQSLRSAAAELDRLAALVPISTESLPASVLSTAAPKKRRKKEREEAL